MVTDGMDSSSIYASLIRKGKHTNHNTVCMVSSLTGQILKLHIEDVHLRDAYGHGAYYCI
jgi:hypothetical protein